MQKKIKCSKCESNKIIKVSKKVTKQFVGLIDGIETPLNAFDIYSYDVHYECAGCGCVCATLEGFTVESN